MGKSSSSLKKKRSSRAQTRKRSKSRLRKSYKSKKVRRRDDSVSYSSDSDDSRSSMSVSSSSSEDDYKSKRSRSRIRKGGKDRKKRARRRSSSDESVHPVKRRKGSKKTNDLKVRKKSDKKRKKKKVKRDVSDSSESSGPLSCSACDNESGSSDESEVERDGSRFDKKGRLRREKVRIGSKRRSRSRSRSPYSQRGMSRSLSPYSQRGRSRSRSWSSYSHSDERDGYRSEENLISEVNPRRLKSVITVVVRERSEDRVREEDEHKEEMIYDYDECPSCRSNDSNDGVSKKDSAQHVALETEMYAEGEKREEPFNFDSGTISEHEEEEGGDRNNHSSSETGVQNAKKETTQKDSSGVEGPRSYDLETSLRLKALENLRTFRKASQVDAAKGPSNQNDTDECELKTLATTKCPEGGDSNKADTAPPPDPKVNVNTALTSVPQLSRLISLSSRHESANACNDMNHASQFQENPPAMSLTDNNIIGTAQSTIPSGNNMSNGEEANNASMSNDPSSHPTALSGDNLNKQQAEATDDSQFQQKTMSVMRGGEMVEVSYKVYIPKKAPALSRRSLRR